MHFGFGLALILLLLSSSAFATVAPDKPEPNDTAEGVSIMVSTVSAVANIMSIAGQTPIYWLGGVGIAAGATSLALCFHEDVAHQGGLLLAGVAAIAASGIAMRYRYVLNQRPVEARLQPSWTHGSPGLALVIDF